MIDAACGYTPDAEPAPIKLTPEQKESCAQLGRDVLSDLRNYYPEVVKTRPTTWPIHLRNTIAAKAERMMVAALANAAIRHGEDGIRQTQDT